MPQESSDNVDVQTTTQDGGIAFVGCGHIAHVHMRYLKKLGMKVSAVCDASELRAREFAARYDIQHVVTSIDTLLEQYKPHTVHLLVPPHLHFRLAKQCLLKGCHVLVEKPCCETLRELQELEQLAASHNCLFTVDHTRVFNPMLIAARERLEAGRYGKVIRMEYVYDDPSIIKQPDQANPVAYAKGAPVWFQKLRGGVVTDLIPHPLSVMLSIDPELGLASAHGRVNTGIVEELIVLLRSPDVDGVITISMHSRPLRNELRIYCEKVQ